MSFYANKKVLVTGGTGLIGFPLVEMLVKEGAEVTVVSLDDASRCPIGAQFKQADLRDFDTCLDVCNGQEIVFQLAGIKGSPKMCAERPASFFVPTIIFSFNMMEAARMARVNRYLFTSSIGVYEPADVFREDDVWKTFPSPNDKFAGWAKRMAELQADAYNIEYEWNNISIVRPANVYGPYDNFDPENAMVIPSLIRRALDGESPLTVWGDGSPIRDFIHAKDVARGMMMAVEKGINVPINLGSGDGVSIKDIVNRIVENLPDAREVVWDTSKPSGDALRLMDMTRAEEAMNFQAEIELSDGIKETMEWYKRNKKIADNRYNVFTEEISTKGVTSGR
jgi:GDP-L-fucose synthase